jgi:uncharacterized repeat protein (TIGR03803 family)
MRRPTSPYQLLSTIFVLALSIVRAHPVQSQTYTVLHNFTGGQDGASPQAGVTMDRAGNLYGTTQSGGTAGFGVVFKLTRRNSAWVLNPLYSFRGGSDGQNPQARVTIGPNGTLYGTTFTGGLGGCPNGCGTIFNLSPPPRACTAVLCPWTETVLYRFTGAGGTESPGLGALTFDQSGNIYGSAQGDEHFGSGGNVYELAFSNGGWTFSVVYTFGGGATANPLGGVILDNMGNLYGTSRGDAFSFGAAFDLTPSGISWMENTLYGFCGGNNDGSNPIAGLIFDPFGNLYGTTPNSCVMGQGTVYELTKQSNGTWIETVLHSFSGNDGANPSGTLAMDSAGNLYGTTYDGGQFGYGTVFRLTPSGGGWTLTTLHQFDSTDGSYPQLSNVVLDANGNLYGTTSQGGAFGNGVVWEITP